MSVIQAHDAHSLYSFLGNRSPLRVEILFVCFHALPGLCTVKAEDKVQTHKGIFKYISIFLSFYM